MIQRPQPGEHNPYFDRYIGLVPEGDFMHLLMQNTADCIAFFKALPADKHGYSYAEGKWTPKEVLMHIIDTERVMSYRALVAARGDKEAVLPGMDENLYAQNVDVTNRDMDSIIAEFAAVRNATEFQFAHMTDAESSLAANNRGQDITPRALGYIIIGHVMHHINITKERY